MMTIINLLWIFEEDLNMKYLFMYIRVCPQELNYEFVYLLDIKKLIDLEKN